MELQEAEIVFLIDRFVTVISPGNTVVVFYA